MGKEFEPNLDGAPKQDNPETKEPETVQISKDDWEAMKSKITTFEAQMGNYNTQYTPPPPPEPQGPTLQEQLSEFDGKIAIIDEQIDKRVEEGKSVSALLKERSKYERQATRLQIQTEDIQPVMRAGLNTMTQLTEKVTKADMPYYDVVRKDLDKHLGNLTPEQKANPEVMKMAYNFAVGDNFQKIFDVEMEKRLRESAAEQRSLDASSSSRTQTVKYNDVEVPDWNSVMGDGTKTALKEKGLSPDEYYRKIGYAGGWPEYYAAHKDYLD